MGGTAKGNGPAGARRRASVLLVAVALGGLIGPPLARADGVAIDIDSSGVVVAQDARCGPEDLPETGLQGDVPIGDQASGRAERGYNCGLSLVGHAVLDADGRNPMGNANMAWSGDCAYVSGPGALFGQPTPGSGDGIAVVDVSDPTTPVHVRTLRTPGAVATSETLHAVTTDERAILVVGQYGNIAGGDKPMDVYDVSDCAAPKLLETFRWPKNIHNLTVSGNGRYVFATQPLQAADLEPLFDGDPATGVVYLGDLEAQTPSPPVAIGPMADLDDLLPSEVRGLTRGNYLSHEAWPSPDGTTLYVGGQLPVFETFSVLDLTDWLVRDGANQPAGPPKVVSQRAGRGHSVRTATVGNRRLVLHSEESVFGPTWGCLPQDLNPFVGPSQPWLTDVTDPADPRTFVQFGLEINEPEHCLTQIESGTNASTHYHDVDDEQDTTFAMVSMWNAGIRVFDLRDPERPTEVAYFNPGDLAPGAGVLLDHAWGHIRWVPETGHLWFATASGGFWVVELEPQVRRQLGLDDGAAPPPVLHPEGRPGTATIDIELGTRPLLDLAPFSCILGPVAQLADSVPLPVPPELFVPPALNIPDQLTRARAPVRRA